MPGTARRHAPGAQRLPHPAGVPLRCPPHPGRFLARHFLRPLSLSQTEAARLLGVSRRRLNEIIQGHRGITPDTGVRLARYFGTDPRFWIALQVAWETHAAMARLRRD